MSEGHSQQVVRSIVEDHKAGTWVGRVGLSFVRFGNSCCTSICWDAYITLNFDKLPPSWQMMAVPFEAMLMPVHYAPSSVGFEASMQAWEFRL